MIHVTTFSDDKMERSSWLCVDSAKKYGADSHSRFNPHNLSQRKEVKENPRVFSQPEDQRRAWSWWAFKPLLIKYLLEDLPQRSTLIYADAGVEFIAPIFPIIERMDQDVFLFGNNWPHYAWCKRDIVDEVWPAGTTEYITLDPWSLFGKQVQASVIFFRVSDYSRAFVAEWLKWCLFEGGRLIDDSPSRAPNHPEFRENRHDQAILTTMAYREGIKLHAWPAVYNRFLGQEFVYSREGYPESDNYPALFHHHRFRNSDFEVNKNGSMDT